MAYLQREDKGRKRGLSLLDFKSTSLQKGFKISYCVLLQLIFFLKKNNLRLQIIFGMLLCGSMCTCVGSRRSLYLLKV